jgi:RHS repeat-associated protein
VVGISEKDWDRLAQEKLDAEAKRQAEEDEQHALGILPLNDRLPEHDDYTGVIYRMKWRYRGGRHYELSNHLGNVQVVVTDKKIAHSSGGVDWAYYTVDVYTASDYGAFGMEIEERGFVRDNKYRYSFNGKETDDETGATDYGFRMSDSRLGRFWSVDPLFKKYPELTTYQFASNMPINSIDLDGLECYAVYNKATDVIVLCPDISKYNPLLSYKVVNAKQYLKLTEEEKKQDNYFIRINGVFTGGHADKNGKVVKNDPTRPNEIPISTGMYNILENKGNAVPGREHFFVLDPVDDSPYNKIDDREGQVQRDGKTKRDGYNWHPGGTSHGCVTVNKFDCSEMIPEQRYEEWESVYDQISKTKLESVPDNRGSGWRNVLGQTQTKYGIMEIIDEPAPKDDKKTKE